MRFAHVERPAPTSARRARRQRGETLVEVLTMIVLMGVGFTAIFSGLMTVSRINELNKRRTMASNAVQAWAETLQQPATALTGGVADAYTYKPCASPATYNNENLPSGWLPDSWGAATAKPVSVEYFTGTFSAGGDPQFNTDQNACWAYYLSAAGGSSRDRGMQRITIKVESPPGTKPAVSDSLVILKRDQRCPPVKNSVPDIDGTYSTRFDNADLGPC